MERAARLRQAKKAERESWGRSSSQAVTDAADNAHANAEPTPNEYSTLPLHYDPPDADGFSNDQVQQIQEQQEQHHPVPQIWADDTHTRRDRDSAIWPDDSHHSHEHAEGHSEIMHAHEASSLAIDRQNEIARVQAMRELQAGGTMGGSGGILSWDTKAHEQEMEDNRKRKQNRNTQVLW